MRSFATLSLLAGVVLGQGVTQYLAPKGKNPAGCVDTKSGSFELSVAAVGGKKREVGKTLQVTLNKGTLIDNLKRVGYIADNYQFQFDGPPQAGSIYTGGWSFCANGSLALGPSAVFYQCLSGEFNNLYDRWWAEQCKPIHIQLHAIGGDSISGSESSGSANIATKAPKAGAGAVSSSTAGGMSATATKASSAATELSATGAKNGTAAAVSSASVTSATATTGSTSLTSASSSGSKSAGNSTAKATSTNAAQMMDTKAHTLAFLLGIVGIAMI